MKSKYYYVVFWRHDKDGKWAPFHSSHRAYQAQLLDSLREAEAQVRYDRSRFPQMQHKIVKFPRP